MVGFNCTPAEHAKGLESKVNKERDKVIDPRDVPKIRTPFNTSLFGGNVEYQRKDITNLK